jgi:hypothetical protein
MRQKVWQTARRQRSGDHRNDVPARAEDREYVDPDQGDVLNRMAATRRPWAAGNLAGD